MTLPNIIIPAGIAQVFGCLTRIIDDLKIPLERRTGRIHYRFVADVKAPHPTKNSGTMDYMKFGLDDEIDTAAITNDTTNFNNRITIDALICAGSMDQLWFRFHLLVKHYKDYRLFLSRLILKDGFDEFIMRKSAQHYDPVKFDAMCRLILYQTWVQSIVNRPLGQQDVNQIASFRAVAVAVFRANLAEDVVSRLASGIVNGKEQL